MGVGLKTPGIQGLEDKQFRVKITGAGETKEIWVGTGDTIRTLKEKVMVVTGCPLQE